MRRFTPALLLSLYLLQPEVSASGPTLAFKQSTFTPSLPSGSLLNRPPRHPRDDPTITPSELSHSSSASDAPSRDVSDEKTLTEESQSSTPSTIEDSPTPNPSPQKPEEKDPRPLPDLSSSTCEPCSDTLPTRKYTLNNGLYCGECHRDGSRENINPENSCDETKIREGLIPIDGRPVVCVGIPGATPASRPCFTNCNAFVSLSRSHDPCHENTFNSGTFCKNCLEGGDPTVVFGNGEGNIDDIKSMDFAGILHSLETWCAEYPRCKDLKTGRRKGVDPACATRFENNPSSPSILSPPPASSTGKGQGASSQPSHFPTPTHQQQRPGETQNDESSKSLEQSSISFSRSSQHGSNGEETISQDSPGGEFTFRDEESLYYSGFSTAFVSSIRITNIDGQTFIPRTTVTGRTTNSVNQHVGQNSQSGIMEPSTSFTSSGVSFSPERAFADATPTGPVTSAAQLQSFSSSKIFLALVASIAIMRTLGE